MEQNKKIMEDNKKSFKITALIYPAIIILALVGLVLAVRHSKKLHPNSAYDKKLGYNVDEYITLGQYKGLEVEQEIYTVTDEDIEYEMEDAATEEVEVEGEIKEGDFVNVDITATADGEVVDDLTNEDYDICVGDGDFGTEVDEQLVGQKAGNAINVDVKNAGDIDENYEGQAVSLYVVINSATNYIEHDLTDEYVKENLGFDTLDEYRESVKKDLEEEGTEDNEYAMKEELYQMAVDNATMNGYPDELYDEISENAYAQLYEEAEEWGMSDDMDGFFESFYEKEEGQSTDAFLEEYYKEMIKSELVMHAIAKAEKLEVTDDIYNEKVKEYVEDYEYDSVEEFEEDYEKDEIKDAILSDLVYDFLAENAKITMVEPSEEDDDEYYDDDTLEEDDEYYDEDDEDYDEFEEVDEDDEDLYDDLDDEDADADSDTDDSVDTDDIISGDGDLSVE